MSGGDEQYHRIHLPTLSSGHEHVPNIHLPNLKSRGIQDKNATAEALKHTLPKKKSKQNYNWTVRTGRLFGSER